MFIIPAYFIPIPITIVTIVTISTIITIITIIAIIMVILTLIINLAIFKYSYFIVYLILIDLTILNLTQALE